MYFAVNIDFWTKHEQLTTFYLNFFFSSPIKLFSQGDTVKYNFKIFATI